MAKLIECGLPTDKKNDDSPDKCPGVIAHQVSPRMLHIKRGDQDIVFVGSDWNAQVSCPRCGRKHAVTCTGGKIHEDELHYREPKPDDDNPKPDDKPNKEGDDDGQGDE